MKHMLSRLIGDDAGQDLIEYGLLIGIVTLACVIAIQGIGGKVAAYFANLNALLP